MEGNKHKVLVIAPGRKTRGGITSVIRHYAEHPLWIAWNCYWLETYIDRSNVEKLLYFFRSLIKFTWLIHKYTIVHIHFSEPPSAIRKCFFMIPSLLLGKKVILHFHSFSPDTTLNGGYRKLYRWMFRNADAVIVLSAFWHKQVGDFLLANSRLQVIHNPAKQYTSSSGREQFILFAGTLNARKGYKDLLAAFALLKHWHTDWKLVFAGNGELEEARSLCRQLGITDQVELKGWVDGDDKRRLFQRASVFCLPSYAEGFPMAVIDAMSHQIPVVATPVGGLKDIFREMEDLLYVPPGETKELAARLDRMILYPPLRNRLAASASEKIRRYFDMDIIGAKLNGLYGELSGEG